MAVTNATIRAIAAVLDLDAGATPATKQAVTRLLHGETPKQLEEGEAASLLDMSRTTLSKWRNGEWEKAPHGFIFRTWFSPTNEVRYSVKELEAYNLIRELESTRECPQPDIDRVKLENMMKLVERGLF